MDGLTGETDYDGSAEGATPESGELWSSEIQSYLFRRIKV